MMFSAITQTVNAQKGKDKKKPPTGYFCQCGVRGYGCGTGGAKCVQYCAGACGAWIANDTAITSIPAINISANPSSSLTVVNFQLSKTGNVSLKIFNATGKLIKALADENMQQGNHQFEWDNTDEDGNAVSAGIYILQFDTPDKSETKKLAVID